MIGFGARPAAAHNTLLSSVPADGASLTSAPTQVIWNFDRSVPLDSVTVTLIDASGARTNMPTSTHGPAGSQQVITALPSPEGAVSLRWRLVGPDGHPISGRVDFTVVAASATATVSALPPGDAAAASTHDFEETPVPDWMKWLLRYASYLCIFIAAGILLTGAAIWPGARTHPRLRQLLGRSLHATALLAALHVIVIATDISGAPPWGAFDAIEPALRTDAGAALAVRALLALVMWVMLFRYDDTNRMDYWQAVALLGLGLLCTWAIAGHSYSMRWPVIGVATDVAHHGAAALWLGGLVIVSVVVVQAGTPREVLPVVRRFSVVAGVSVGVLAVTGLVQSVRLVGSPLDLLETTHGRLLAVKIGAVVCMLGAASVNRARVRRTLDHAEVSTSDRNQLRTLMLVEFAIGLVVVALTAGMVVAPPAQSRAAGPAIDLYYTA